MPRVRELEVLRVVLPYGPRSESLLVKLTDQAGMTGWGEAVSPEPKAWSRLEESLGALLIGVDWEHPDSVPSGDSAVDMACWDLWTRMRGVPLADAIGGTRTSLMATVRLTPDASIDSLVSRVNQQVCAGYGHVTLDIRPGWDVEPVRAVRAAYPALTLAVDCGCAYTDSGQLVALDSYGLQVIERPFPVDRHLRARRAAGPGGGLGGGRGPHHGRPRRLPHAARGPGAAAAAHRLPLAQRGPPRPRPRGGGRLGHPVRGRPGHRAGQGGHGRGRPACRAAPCRAT